MSDCFVLYLLLTCMKKKTSGADKFTNNNQVKIGKFISDERKAKGYTQKQLSELLGISDKTISKWECRVSPTKGY